MYDAAAFQATLMQFAFWGFTFGTVLCAFRGWIARSQKR